MATCGWFADEARGLAARYGNLKFAGTLHAAADNLFTFLRYPGMPPTNNGSERDMYDWVVPIREVSHKFVTERGMCVFSILQIFAATCSKLNLDVGESFLRVLHDPAYNIVREGLSATSAAPPMLPVCITPSAPSSLSLMLTTAVFLLLYSMSARLFFWFPSMRLVHLCGAGHQVRPGQGAPRLPEPVQQEPR